MRILGLSRALSLSLIGLACSGGDPDSPAVSGVGGAGGAHGLAGAAPTSAAGSSSGSGSGSGVAGAPVLAGGTSGGGTGSAGAASGGAGAGGVAVAAGAGGTGAGGTGTGGSGNGGGGPLIATKVFIAGDSTVSTYKDTASDKDQAGWGQMLPEFFGSLVTVDNRAVGGRTARRFIDEGYLDKIFTDIRKGDYLLVQFGTNDSNKSATYTLNGQTIPYYLDPATDFKTYLQKYIDGAASRGATTILVTPPPRNSAYCTGGNGTGAYADAMRQLGTAQSLTVSDLNRKSVDYLKAICPSPTPEDFFLLKADGSVDGTHFQENGARHLARFVSEGLREASSPLAAYLK
ncbi:MAG TPA: rhamnogalacturonan acetylesterase [Polyangiaceae bacterium]|nr:rhamnogalacturonan acetylesterase [Polyangiaceae bacterium]